MQSARPLEVSSGESVSPNSVDLAQELRDNISQHLPPLSLQPAAEDFDFKMSSCQKGHNQIWSEIFKDEAWAIKAIETQNLNPVLIGSSVREAYHRKTSEKTRIQYDPCPC